MSDELAERRKHNQMLIDRIEGLPAHEGGEDDPANPNVDRQARALRAESALARLSAPSEELVKACAKAVHKARYAAPDHQREPEPFVHAADIEYCTRLTKAVLAEIAARLGSDNPE